MRTSLSTAAPLSDDFGAALTGSLADMPLEATLACIEARVREQPGAASHRWALFQVLCALGQWTRGIQQLQVYARLSPDQAQVAHAYRDLICAERWRARVMEGRARPGFVYELPLWAEGLIEALRLSADGHVDEADRARETALDQTPPVPARTALFRFDWIADSDSRLGPVCEVVTAGRYRWLAFSDVAAWQIAPPSSLVDLVWAPCELTLIDGTAVRGFMPARYPGSETLSDDEGDALRLGRKTRWRESGRTGVIALGRKTWVTNAGDFSLFELEACEFGTGMAENAHGEPQAQDGGNDAS